MIGGRVLDASALVAFATRTSVYLDALIWTAVEESLVLVVPSTAVAAAVGRLGDDGREVLEVLLRLPVTVVDDLTAARARTIGGLGGDPVDAHAAACAGDRGWPLVTVDADRYGDRAVVEVEQLP